MSPVLKICSFPGCGRVCETLGTKRCALHPKPHKRSGTYTRNAAKVRAQAVACWICGGGPRADDPWVADHVVPRAYGGRDDVSNLKPAHRSCNGRRGASLQA